MTCCKVLSVHCHVYIQISILSHAKAGFYILLDACINLFNAGSCCIHLFNASCCIVLFSFYSPHPQRFTNVVLAVISDTELAVLVSDGQWLVQCLLTCLQFLFNDFWSVSVTYGSVAVITQSFSFVWPKNQHCTSCANLFTKFFHTCQAYRHNWPLPCDTIVSDLDLGLGSQGQQGA